MFIPLVTTNLLSSPCEHETKISDVRAHSKLTPLRHEFMIITEHEFYWNVHKNNFGRSSGLGHVRASHQRKLRLTPVLA
jgi:hypothetical protein